MKAVIVHGGAGSWRPERLHRARQGVEEAVQIGFQVLLEGGTALDACEAAVRAMEDNPVFNAGTGSALTLDGRCEMDASIMRGTTLEAGAVAGVERIKNPISLARRVLEETDHVLLIGEGAERLARVLGFPEYNPITEERRRQWEQLREQLTQGKVIRWPKLRRFLQEHPEYLKGTVGCVALDDSGEIVAGTSTGGVFLKLYGRVGDTPVIGAGTYASPFGGASATGVGEGIMRTLLTYTVVHFMRMGLSPMQAAQAGIDYLNRTVGTDAGVIVLGPDGEVGFAKNTPYMPVALLREGMSEVEVFL